jgi:hypothetical protein
VREPHPAPTIGRGVVVGLDDDLSVGVQEHAGAAQKLQWISADPDVAVEEQQRLPTPLTDCARQHIGVQDRQASSTGDVECRVGDVDPHRFDMPIIESSEDATGPAPDVEYRALTPISNSEVSQIRPGQPAGYV